MIIEQFAAGGGGGSAGAYGSIVAWVNFQGDGTVAINASSSNVSSITDNGTGDYTINFSPALPANNYGVYGSGTTAHALQFGVSAASYASAPTTKTTSACRVQLSYDSGNYVDCRNVYVLFVL